MLAGVDALERSAAETVAAAGGGHNSEPAVGERFELDLSSESLPLQLRASMASAAAAPAGATVHASQHQQSSADGGTTLPVSALADEAVITAAAGGSGGVFVSDGAASNGARSLVDPLPPLPPLASLPRRPGGRAPLPGHSGLARESMSPPAAQHRRQSQQQQQQQLQQQIQMLQHQQQQQRSFYQDRQQQHQHQQQQLGLLDAAGEYSEAGSGPASGFVGRHPHPSMSSAMNSTLSRIDQLMRDQERQYMTLPSLQNTAVNVKHRDYSFVGGGSNSTYDYAGSTEPLPTSAAIRKKQDSFTACSALFTVFSILVYVSDLATDGLVCYLFYVDRSLACAATTFAVAVLPSVIVNIFSVRWYIQDDRESTKALKESGPTASLEDAPLLHRPKMSPCDWLIRIFFHGMLLGPVVRYMELLLYGIRAKKQAKLRGSDQQWPPFAPPNRIEQPKERQVDYYLLMIHEDRDTALLSLFKSVLQSAPQATLQLVLIASEFSSRGHVVSELRGGCQLISVFVSLMSIALSLSSYHRALRRSVPDKYNMSRAGAILQFIWRFCTVGSRIICIALFTSEYTFWLIPLCIGHWGVMSVWVMHQGTRFCDTESGQPRQCEEYLFDMLIGAIYLVCFLNVKDEPTRYKYTGYYLITCVENVITIVLWYFRAGDHIWYRLPVLVGAPSLFAFGILIMTIYYRYYHPNGMLPIYNPIARCC